MDMEPLQAIRASAISESARIISQPIVQVIFGASTGQLTQTQDEFSDSEHDHDTMSDSVPGDTPQPPCPREPSAKMSGKKEKKHKHQKSKKHKKDKMKKKDKRTKKNKKNTKEKRGSRKRRCPDSEETLPLPGRRTVLDSPLSPSPLQLPTLAPASAGTGEPSAASSSSPAPTVFRRALARYFSYSEDHVAGRGTSSSSTCLVMDLDPDCAQSDARV